MRGADDGDGAGAVGCGGADAGARHARFGAAGALCRRRDHAWTTKTKKKKKKKKKRSPARRQEGENDWRKRGGRSVIVHLRITVPP